MIEVSNADRVVFPEIGRTKGDVVAYYDRIAPKMLPHVVGRPVSTRRIRPRAHRGDHTGASAAGGFTVHVRAGGASGRRRPAA